MGTTTTIEDTPVSALVEGNAFAAGILVRAGIDPCDGADRTLREACEGQPVDAAKLAGEIQAATPPAPSDDAGWESAPLGALIDHIIKTYHDPYPATFELLNMLARYVRERRPDDATEPMTAVLGLLEQLGQEIQPHLRKEEDILFPLIRSGQGAAADGPIEVMGMEHVTIQGILASIRALTNDYAPPAAACATWRALWAGLAAFEAALIRHTRLEEDVLFRRALAGDVV